jgi:mycothiol synthase
MLPPAGRRPPSAVRELLTQANEAPYDIDVVAGEKLYGDGYEGAAHVDIHGDHDGIAVTCGKYLRLLAVHPDRRNRGIGTTLLRRAEGRGAKVVAAEPGNYFTPGIIDTDTATIEFFKKRGYAETARTQNLIAKPADGGRRTADGAREETMAFIEANFGPIWRFEASHAETIFHIEADGEIAGFATHEANNRGLGFFGPTGVAERFRGRGFGRDLLLASLDDLGRRGFRDVVIPWTDAIDFYRKSCGAVVAHKFVIMRRIAP